MNCAYAAAKAVQTTKLWKLLGGLAFPIRWRLAYGWALSAVVLSWRCPFPLSGPWWSSWWPVGAGCYLALGRCPGPWLAVKP